MLSFPEELLERLRSARHVTVFTGAGISAESGVPTFQGGFWGKYSPEQLATVEGFRRDPKLVWDWYAMRRETVRAVQPNPGHLALVELERRVGRCTIATQNVDGLHRRAGNSRVLELHGSIVRVKCLRENTPATGWETSAESPPRCSDCGAYLRPDVVWFGEPLPAEVFDDAVEASRDCDLFFSVGTATQVYPAASLPSEALAAGVPVVEVNPALTPLSADATYVFRGASGQVLPQLIAAAWPPPGRSD